MGRDFMIGCVGKPSAGKSTFFNAVTEGNAKVGNYPFTTIEPNTGVSYYMVDCPCARYDKQEQCAPRYGKCRKGVRYVPVKLLDVAGLIPGASEGLGLGNKFLDDLRQADVLLHILDVSGNTNEKGEVTTGYDPSADHDWLQQELHNWIFNNLWTKWSSITRRHMAVRASALDTLAAQFSGYGTTRAVVGRALDRLNIKEPSHMEEWDIDMVHRVVDSFLEERFKLILVLNKADMGGDTDKNAAKLCRKYDPDRIVLASALAECFLKKMKQQGFIEYNEGSDHYETAATGGVRENGAPLKEMDEKTLGRLEKIQDMVLFRHNSTGVHQAIKKAVEIHGLIPVYPVKNVHNFTCDASGHVFRDCLLVEPGSTVRDVARLLSPDLDKNFSYAEGVDGRRMGEADIVTFANNIFKIATAADDESQ